MRVQYFILMLCMSTTSLNSQMLLDIYATNPCKNFEESGFTISGQIVDQESGEPIMFANVALYHADGALLTGVETDLDGRYSFSNIPKGEYHIESSFISYQLHKTADILVNKDILDLDIKLKEMDMQEVYSRSTCSVPLIRKDIAKAIDTKTNEEDLFTLSGQILDESTGEPVIFASVALYNDEGIIISGAETNLEGTYVLRGIKKGSYSIEPSFIGYEPKTITGFVNRDVLDLDIEIRESIFSCCNFCGCGGFRKPLIRQDNTTSGIIITSNEIRHMR